MCSLQFGDLVGGSHCSLGVLMVDLRAEMPNSPFTEFNFTCKTIYLEGQNSWGVSTLFHWEESQRGQPIPTQGTERILLGSEMGRGNPASWVSFSGNSSSRWRFINIMYMTQGSPMIDRIYAFCCYMSESRKSRLSYRKTKKIKYTWLENVPLPAYKM